MFYKLSNTSPLLLIEAAFDAKFKYPLLFKNAPIINGLSEQTLPVITMNNPNKIDYAIWGALPQDYKDGWENFQNLTNTLNMSIDKIQTSDWTNQLLNHQRCLIIVSGFFTSYLHNGEVYPFYVYERNHRPFALAGIYSTLNDGFLSVSLTTSTMTNGLKNIHNIGPDFPIAMDGNNARDWIDPDLTTFDESNLVTLNLKAHTISKEFYKNDIIYDSILEPAHYNGMPILSVK
ncbi:SOS response-associated peptidase family protein [Winogradskyella bathintestinalis]|uniref:Abasic site processing protein n=1 Tax=Winogradskyella bathintestinalis TaxID=3035208 RepID=A0ABT7ZTJ9_9FLAO|nr:SOS response-associated peptidase family protein [Winogradskyella bathintestinalis]MDN3492346.1 SOS response-associated peptidase family protein [Winogradskyella bathintestinalis]